MDKIYRRFHELRLGAHKYATLNNAVLVVALFIALGWVWGSVDALGRNYKYQQQVDAGQGEVDLLDLQTQNLQAEQSYLQSDEYLGLAARAKLNKALPGEKELILPATTATTSTARTPEAPAPSNFAQWMDFLFGKRSQG